MGWSLSQRSVFEHRAVAVGADRRQLMAGLAAIAGGEPGAGVMVGRAAPVGKTVMVFPGQGSQAIGMGRELYDQSPVFAKAFDAVADELDRHLRLPLRQVVWGDDQALLDTTEFAQPALFAVETSLFTLLRSWGLGPDFVMGHSVGELSAAYVAGVLTLADAAMLVAARGRLMQGLRAGGAMVSVGAGEHDVAPLLREGVAIAAINAPESVVISGAQSAVSAIAQQFGSAGQTGPAAGGLPCVSFAVDGADAQGVRAGRCLDRGAGPTDRGGVQCDGRAGQVRLRFRVGAVLGESCSPTRAIRRQCAPSAEVAVPPTSSRSVLVAA